MNSWKDVQRRLGDLAVDGIPGPLTAAATARALGLEPAANSRATWTRVQRHLGIAPDGIPGPVTLATVALALEGGQRPEDDAPPSELDPYGLARRYIGTREIPGRKHNPVIVRWHRRLATWISDDETPWCSSFVDYCAAETGRESTGKLHARSWLEVGLPVSLAEARPGDVVIFWRGSRSSWTGHVAFFEHFNRKRNLIYVLGGNQRNEVNVMGYPRNRLLGIRRLRPLDELERGRAA